jgi:hypothetical protein
MAVWLLVLAGCIPGGPAGLVIATDLPERECRALEAAFRRSLTAETAPGLSWIRVAPGADPARLAGGVRPVDVVIRSLPPADAAGWRAFRRPDLGLIAHRGMLEVRALTLPDRREALANPALAGLIALDDPRRDAVTIALAGMMLEDGPWAEGYRALVRLGSLAAPMGRGDTALARLERGEAALAVTTQHAPELPDRPIRRLGPGPVAYAKALSGTVHEELARRLVDSLESGDSAAAFPGATTLLLADLLGSTLVDAQPELVEARSSLERLGGAEADRFWDVMGEAPPWPPASIRRLRADHSSATLVEDLAAQLAPELDVRYWLLQSWDASPRPIDGAMLETLATAVEGKLASEPRFRAWLRSEWTAWARQRYRRVARRAEAAMAASSAGSRP